MKDHYQVKFRHPETGRTIYGVADSYGDDVDDAAKEGSIIVSDALTPERYIVPEHELVDIPTNWQVDSEYNKHIKEDFRRAQTFAAKLPDGVQVGAIFAIGVGDGYAWYIVTKVNKRTCKVEWRGWGGGDRYVDHYLGWEGTYPINKIEPYIRRNRWLSKSFGNQ